MVSIREMLGGAQAAGAEHAQQRQEATTDRIQGVKDRIRAGWEAVKGGAKKTGETAVQGSHIVEGLVATQEGRGLFGQFCRERIQAGREAINNRMEAIGRGFTDRRDALVQGIQDTAHNIARGAQEHVIDPAVDRARAIGRGIAHAAHEGALFGLGAAALTGMALESGARATGRGIKAGAEAVGGAVKAGAEWVGKTASELAQEAKERAQNWGTRFSGFVRHQGERLTNGVRRGAAEVHALYHEVTAVPDRAIASVNEWRANRIERSLEKAKNSASERRTKANAAREKARGYRDGANGLHAEAGTAQATVDVVQ